MFDCWIKPLPKCCFSIDAEGNDVCCPFLQLRGEDCICMLIKNGQESDNYKLNRRFLHRRPTRCPLKLAGRNVERVTTKIRYVKPEQLEQLQEEIKVLKDKNRTQQTQITKLQKQLDDCTTNTVQKLEEELSVYKMALYNRVKKSCVITVSNQSSLENKIQKTVSSELNTARKQLEDTKI